METSPIEVYAIVLDILRAPRKVTWRGFTRSMEDIARSAARKSLHDRPLDTRTTEMNIRLDDYTRFTLYHTRCAIRLLDFFVAEDFTKKTGTGWVWYNTRCEVCLPASNCTVVRDGAQENAKHPAIWWVDYWGKIVASVRDSPCERLVDEEPIWASTLHDLAKECPTCHEAAEREFPVFKATLVAEIKRIVDGVRIRFVC